MTTLLDQMIARFPDFETAIRNTKELGNSLGAKFQELQHVEHRLAKLHGADEPDADRLRRHRAALEEEMLTMMQHYGRP